MEYSRKYEVKITLITKVYYLPIFWKEPGRMSGWNQKYFGIYFEIHFRSGQLS